MSDYWRNVAKEILREYREHPSDWMRQPTIRKHLAPDVASGQHATYFDLIRTFCGISRTIVELGGGYGGLASFLYRYTTSYTIVDLSEMIEFQQAVCAHLALEYLDFFPERCAPPNADSLFIATFSLSEIDLAEREAIEPHLSGYRSLFVAYNREFGGVDNVAYFDGLREKLSPTHHTISIHRSERSHRYLIANRK